ncbi:MAG: hypothetical protein U5J63_14980 [Fodinibius sp.]|nr:hypothetical protein [Fodinibius sp.]
MSDQGYTVAPVTIDNNEYIYAYCYYRAEEEGNEELKKSIREDYLQYLERIFTFYEDLSASFLGYEHKQICCSRQFAECGYLALDCRYDPRKRLLFC